MPLYALDCNGIYKDFIIPVGHAGRCHCMPLDCNRIYKDLIILAWHEVRCHCMHRTIARFLKYRMRQCIIINGVTRINV